MIFGKFGFPAWGLAGAAIATMLSQWIRFSIYITIIFLTDRKEKQYAVISGMKPDWQLLRRLLYYGTPTGLYTFIDTITFTMFLMIIGGLGEVERNATTIAFTMNSLTFIPLSGIGIVVTSMVGNQLGDNRSDLARRATMTALVIGSVYTGFFALLFFAIPQWLLLAFAAFSNPGDFDAIRNLSITLFQFMAVYLCFDSCSIIFCSTLRGAGDTIFIMLMLLILAPFFVLMTWIGVYVFGLGISWCWIAVTCVVFAYCAGFTIRYLGGKWETMRVIEKEWQKEIS
jgi:MATE family multidrug resistance protein